MESVCKRCGGKGKIELLDEVAGAVIRTGQLVDCPACKPTLETLREELKTEIRSLWSALSVSQATTHRSFLDLYGRLPRCTSKSKKGSACDREERHPGVHTKVGKGAEIETWENEDEAAAAGEPFVTPPAPEDLRKKLETSEARVRALEGAARAATKEWNESGKTDLFSRHMHVLTALVALPAKSNEELRNGTRVRIRDGFTFGSVRMSQFATVESVDTDGLAATIKVDDQPDIFRTAVSNLTVVDSGELDALRAKLEAARTCMRDERGVPRSVDLHNLVNALGLAEPATSAGSPAAESRAIQACGVYMGDNDGTCPQLTCIRDKGHEGAHDNVCGDVRPDPVPVAAGGEPVLVPANCDACGAVMATANADRCPKCGDRYKFNPPTPAASETPRHPDEVWLAVDTGCDPYYRDELCESKADAESKVKWNGDMFQRGNVRAYVAGPYVLATSDIRTETRTEAFADLVHYLKSLGVEEKVLDRIDLWAKSYK